MPRINANVGEPYDIRRLGTLEWWCDLIEHEGPLLSLFHVENRHMYLASWLKRLKGRDQWLLFRVTDGDLREYLHGEETLLSLIRTSQFILSFDITPRGRRDIRRISWRDIPRELMPSSDSTFDVEFGTDAAQQLITETSASYNVWIDSDWYLDDLSEVPKLYKQIYAFTHAVDNVARADVRRRVGAGLVNQPFRGGYSIVNLITAMNDAIPPISRVKVEAIRKQSPGFLRLRADPQITREVEDVMKRLSKPQTKLNLQLVYRVANNFLDDNGLRRVEANSFNAGYADFENLNVALVGHVEAVLQSLGRASQAATLLEVGGALPTLKSLLAYVKRLLKLHRYVEDGLITKFGGDPPQGHSGI